MRFFLLGVSAANSSAKLAGQTEFAQLHAYAVSIAAGDQPQGIAPGQATKDAPCAWD